MQFLLNRCDKFFTTLNAPFLKMHELTDCLKSLNITTLDFERRVCVQARVPVGRTIMELPAGMLDDDAGDFVGTAAREVHTHLSSPAFLCWKHSFSLIAGLSWTLKSLNIRMGLAIDIL